MSRCNPSPCLHCRQQPAKAWRRLCWACYKDVAVRALYPLLAPSKRTIQARSNGPCLHCNLRPGYLRQLCAKCHKDHAIRDLYPTLRPWRAPAPAPTEPAKHPRGTAALPGSQAKVRVLIARMAKGLKLFSAKDAKRDTE